jgi:nucleotide-binding universal stress UspA family protein
MHTSSGRRVVVGVNGSLGSLAALHLAAAEAHRTDGQLWAVLVWDPPPTEFTQRGYLPSPALLEACRRAAGLELATALDKAFGSDGPDVPLDGLVTRGAPGRALVQIASREDDLLVVGTGRRSLLRRALFPSVARYCVAHAVCPVLTVPPPAMQHELEAASRRNALRLPLDTRELDAGRISEV